MYQPRSVLTYKVCPSKCIASTSRGDTQRKNLVDNITYGTVFYFLPKIHGGNKCCHISDGLFSLENTLKKCDVVFIPESSTAGYS